VRVYQFHHFGTCENLNHALYSRSALVRVDTGRANRGKK
jgi:hypothetical protein